MRLAIVVTVAITAFGAFDMSQSEAADIRLGTTRAVATILSEIGSQFEKLTGHTLKVSSDLGPNIVKRINTGEKFDLIIVGPTQIDQLIKAGRLVAATRTGVVRSGIGVEVRAGAPKPDISSVDAFKKALLNAKSIAYLKEGASGVYIAGMLERLGIADAIKAKVTRPDTDIVSELVAKGEIELGMVVSTQILTTKGVVLVGPLPTELQSYITFFWSDKYRLARHRSREESGRFSKGTNSITSHQVARDGARLNLERPSSLVLHEYVSVWNCDVRITSALPQIATA